MLLGLCRKCQKPVPYPMKYCGVCQTNYDHERKENERVNQRRYDRKRDKKYIRFYKSKEWQQLSGAYMQAKGYQCEFKGKRCQRMATEVHHVEPIQKDSGWIRRLDYDNLMAVCVQCHNEVHKRFR